MTFYFNLVYIIIKDFFSVFLSLFTTQKQTAGDNIIYTRVYIIFEKPAFKFNLVKIKSERRYIINFGQIINKDRFSSDRIIKYIFKSIFNYIRIFLFKINNSYFKF